MTAAARAARAASPDLALLAFPELATTGYQCGRRFHELAVSWPDGGCLIDCLGVAAATAGATRDALVTGLVDEHHTEATRAGYGSQLRDRRPDLYAALVAPVDHPVGPATSAAPAAGPGAATQVEPGRTRETA